MKKKIITALLAGTLATATVVPVYAGTATDVTPYNSTTVTANIVDPGHVSYVITIPESADFGTLTMPNDSSSEHYKFYGFQVEATELNIKSNQGVTVYMKDSSSTDNQFYISQKDAETPFTIAYDVYGSIVNEENIGSSSSINTTATPGSYGYHLCTFLAGSTGSKQDVTLALNQNALYGKEYSQIAGDYSGTIAFHSALIER